MNDVSSRITTLEDCRLSIGRHRIVLYIVLLMSLAMFASYQLGLNVHKLLRYDIHVSQTATISPRENYTSLYLTKLVVISHYSENLEWINPLINDGVAFVVYTTSSKPLPHHRKLPINKGREAVAYLQYIVDFYENLPSSIAFVHGHRTSWHQKDPSDIVVAIRALRWHKYNYAPLTSAKTYANFIKDGRHIQDKVNYELWQSVMQKELGPPPSNGIRTHCCATFAVRREAILRHPIAFYAKMIDYILASNYSDQITGRTIEYTWHMIFGESSHIHYKTCDVFFCDSRGQISVPSSNSINKTRSQFG